MSEILDLGKQEKPLSHDIYLTPESISIAALIDQLDKYLVWKKTDEAGNE